MESLGPLRHVIPHARRASRDLFSGACVAISQSRRYSIDRPNWKVLDGPLLDAMKGQATIQGHENCEAHVRTMRERMESSLVAQGKLAADDKQGLVACGLDGLSTDRCMELNREHGLGELVQWGIQAPGEKYASHHAVMLMASFKDAKGRAVGMIADFSDLQDNPGMRAIREWQQRQRPVDQRPLSELTANDFEAINKTLPKGQDLVDVRQAFVRFVDLEQFLRVKPAGLPAKLMPLREPVIRFSSARLKEPLLSAQQVKALRALLKKNPQAVEQFPPRVQLPNSMLLPPAASVTIGLTALKLACDLFEARGR